jgi:hypothetical protein
MPTRVIQGFFVGGMMRPMAGILQPAAPGGATDARSPAPKSSGPPAPAFASRPGVVQRHGGGGSFPVDAVRLGLARSGGSPLPGPLLAKMEAAFGADFSGIRVHVGPQAARIGAIAFTTGNDLYFSPGRYQPDSVQGQQLIGHELAHVIQQRQGRVRAPGVGVSVVQDHALEAEADRLGMRAAMHRPPIRPEQSAPSQALQRKPAPGAPQPAAPRIPAQRLPHRWSAPIQRAMAAGGMGGPPGGPPGGFGGPPGGFGTGHVSSMPPAHSGKLKGSEAKYRMVLWGRFGMGTFSVDDLCTEIGSHGAVTTRGGQLAILSGLRKAGALFPPITENVRDGLVLSFDSTQAQQAPAKAASSSFTNRQAFGMGNPPHNHPNMVDFWEQHAHTPPPAGRDRREHYMSPSRNFLIGDNNGNPVIDPSTGQQAMEQGHSNLVMGHNPSASTYINATGHMHSPGTNRTHNFSPSAYGQVENAKASAASGSSEPPYIPPSPTRGSWPGYFQRDHPRFDPRYAARWPGNIRKTCGTCGNDIDHVAVTHCTACGAAY